MKGDGAMNILSSQLRLKSGKNDSHQARDEGYIPSIIYGKDMNNLPIKINRREVEAFIRNHGENSLVVLNIGGVNYTAIIKEVQTHPVTQKIIHMDFQKVSEDQKINVKIPVILNGRNYVEKGGAIMQQQIRDVEIECTAGNIPRKLEYDISSFKPGDVLRVADMEVSEEFLILQDPQSIIVSVSEANKISEAEEEEE
ncbi:50S ribosomal protein L25 [Alkaliphilus pronyensis]|uniref:Large ribosomal subunit protein bL25 n=2 Tax=Alkaliphilus pronyensis TaxID=1482732 RepID=A0A6I0FIC1_9FIRM|nr:50S ribosomal protein L25 [Alkaliphilus pronyensis]